MILFIPTKHFRSSLSPSKVLVLILLFYLEESYAENVDYNCREIARTHSLSLLVSFQAGVGQNLLKENEIFSDSEDQLGI